mgnify:CR=1 FL=1
MAAREDGVPAFFRSRGKHHKQGATDVRLVLKRPVLTRFVVLDAATSVVAVALVIGVRTRTVAHAERTGALAGRNMAGENEQFKLLMENAIAQTPAGGTVTLAARKAVGEVQLQVSDTGRGIPEDLREAARVDGASTYQLYRHVIFPQLSPVALTAIIIIGHMSLKVFDLIDNELDFP